MELAVHAHAQIAGGDGLQQLRQLAQGQVADLHHRVEVLHHRAEVVLEPLGVAARAEIAGRSGFGKLLDLRVHRRQVGLGGVHRLGQHRFLAGQALHVFAQVADRIALDDLYQAQLHRHVRGDQVVAGLDHAAVVAGEGGRVHAIADRALLVALRHLVLRVDHRADAATHVQHIAHQLADLVAGMGTHRTVQLAAGDRLRQLPCRIELPRDAAREQPADAGRSGNGQHQQDQDQQLGARQLRVDDVHFLVQLRDVVVGQRHDAFEQCAPQRPRLRVGDGLRGGDVARPQRIAHRGIALQVGVQFFPHPGIHLPLRLLQHHPFDDRLVLRHFGARLLHAVEVVGHRFRIVGARNLRQFVGAELAKLRADFGQRLRGRHPIQLDALELGHRQGSARISEHAYDQGQQRGHGECEDQLVADFQLFEEVH